MRSGGSHVPPDPAAASLVQAISQEIDRVLLSVLGRRARVALLNFPNHANAGDSAVWLGAHAALRRLGARIVHQTAWFSYDRRALSRTLGDGTILLNGGGNFGDLYPGGQQGTREKVLADFPGARVVQLPQSIWFEERSNLERMRRLCEAHHDLTLLVRETQSLSIARREFGVRSLLCPDMAFSMGCLARPGPPSVDVVWVARNDKEAAVHPAVRLPEGVERLDWLGPLADEPAWPRTARLARWANDGLRSHPGPGAVAWRRRLLTHTFAPLGRQWVARAGNVLSRGRAVVTDRLHGHILALLLSIPHVLIDNSNGKVRATYDTWTGASPLTSFCDTPADALDLALALARGRADPSAGGSVA